MHPRLHLLLTFARQCGNATVRWYASQIWTGPALAAALCSVAPAQPSFEPGVSYTVGNQPVSISAGDIAGNTFMDLVVADSAGVRVRFNSGTGDFPQTLEQNIPFGGLSPSAVTTGDIDGDGFDDVIIGTETGSVFTYFGSATGVIAGGGYAAGGLVDSLVAADFDGDGDLDVAAAVAPPASAGHVRRWANDGAGGLTLVQTRLLSQTAPSALIAADLDNDGDHDLAFVEPFPGGSIGLLANNGFGAMSNPSWLTALGQPLAVVAIDCDDDGLLDLMASTTSVGVMWRNTGSMAFVPASPSQVWTGGIGNGMVTGDFDGDGDDDVAISDTMPDGIIILERTGWFSFDSTVLPAGGVNPAGITAADFDGDGQLDLASINFSSASFTVYPATPVPAGPCVFNVNTELDLADPDLTDGVADGDLSAPGIQCSLRVALQNAGLTTEPCTIHLPAGTYSLTGAANENACVTGDLDIWAGDVTILGAGQATTFIDGGSMSDRLLDVYNGITVSVADLTLQGGSSGAADGGGIRVNDTAGTLVLERVRVRDCSTSGDGGGIYARGSIQLTDVLITGNSANDGGGLQLLSAGSGQLTDTLIKGNTATVSGGGMVTWDPYALTLNSVHVIDNIAGTAGGGINNNGYTNVTGSLIAGNIAGTEGGGVVNSWAGTMHLLETTIDSNVASQHFGGGISNASQGTMTLDRCTVSSNQVNSPLPTLGDGGGIANRNGANMELVNCTISGNSANRFGGGFHNTDSAVCLLQSITIANNTSAGGGGVCNDFGGMFAIENTIVAGNLPDDGQPVTPLDSLGYNLDSDGSCGFNATGDLPATDPMLGPLQDNGGPTLTHAPISTCSPVIDASSVFWPQWDQTGILRFNDGNADGFLGTDIGAVEMPASTTPCNPCPGDMNCDGIVDVDDLVAVITCWGGTGGGCNGPAVSCDVDALVAVILNWGGCP